MTTDYTWKQNAWTGNYTLYRSNQPVGYLKKRNFFSAMMEAFTGSMTYTIGPAKWWLQQPLIIDQQGNKIGYIRYNKWGNRATVNLHGKAYRWQYSNGLNTRWEIKNADGTAIGSSTGTPDEGALLAAGLYIHSRLRHRTTAIVILVLYVPMLLRFFMNR